MSISVTTELSKSVEVQVTPDFCVAYDVDLQVTARVIYRPAKVSGPPETCYPDESEIRDREIKVVCIYDEYGQIVPYSAELEAKILSSLNSDDIDCDIWEAFNVGD